MQVWEWWHEVFNLWHFLEWEIEAQKGEAGDPRPHSQYVLEATLLPPPPACWGPICYLVLAAHPFLVSYTYTLTTVIIGDDHAMLATAQLREDGHQIPDGWVRANVVNMSWAGSLHCAVNSPPPYGKTHRGALQTRRLRPRTQDVDLTVWLWQDILLRVSTAGAPEPREPGVPAHRKRSVSLGKADGQEKLWESLAHFSDEVIPNVGALDSEQNNPFCQTGAAQLIEETTVPPGFSLLWGCLC